MFLRNVGLPPNYTAFQSRRPHSSARNQLSLDSRLLLLVSCLAYCSSLKIEAIYYSETLGCLLTTRYYNPEDRTLHSHRRQSLKTEMNLVGLWGLHVCQPLTARNCDAYATFRNQMEQDRISPFPPNYNKWCQQQKINNLKWEPEASRIIMVRVSRLKRCTSDRGRNSWKEMRINLKAGIT
jgi:hypothetical protein